MPHAGLGGVPASSFSEGEPGADPPAWVFERSLEGESEMPRESAGMDAGANARWSSAGLSRAHHYAGAGSSASLLPASGRQLSRRSTFSPQAAVVALASTRWRKTRTLLKHPPTPSPGWLLRGGSCLVARLFRRRLLWWRWHRQSGEKLKRSSSTRRPLRLLGGQAWCSSLLAARRLAQRVSLRSSVERSIPRMLAALVLLPLAASMVARM